MMGSAAHWVLAAALAALPAMALAGDGGRDEERGRAHEGDGRGLSELTAEWWQWALSIPASVNPLLQTTTAGESRCVVGQRGPVWFLGGTFTSGSLSRQCTVPEGVTLFFPVINSFQNNSPGFCGQPADVSFTVAQLRANVAAFIDAATGVFASIDGKPIRSIRRVKSVPFVSVFPADNVFVDACAQQTPPGNPAGAYSPTVDDGYYAKVEGLRPGRHVLFFRADSGAFHLDVTYDLDVVPASLR